MSYRFMRMLIMFDLPMSTSEQRRSYRSFRKFLLSTGFMQLQESIYSKIVLNESASKLVAKQVRAHKPGDGSVCLLVITEKQYAKMEILVGNVSSEMIDTSDRTIYL